MTEKIKKEQRSQEQIAAIFNGVYAMLMEENFVPIMATVNELPRKIDDSLLKAVINYRQLTREAVKTLMFETYAIYKKYYGKITKDNSEQLFKELLDEIDSYLDGKREPSEIDPKVKYESIASTYVREIFAILLSDIEEKYKSDLERSKA